MKILPSLFERSLLMRLGIAMGTITLLSVIAMASSIIIAGITQGSAATINQTGTLRMQSYRIASLIQLAQNQNTAARWEKVEAGIHLFERTLYSKNLIEISVAQKNANSAISYQGIASDWQTELKPKLQDIIKRSHTSLHQPLQMDIELLDDIHSFVTKIDGLVQLLAVQAENRITLLSTILGIALFLIVTVVTVTMYVVYTDVLIPLRELLSCTENFGRGDLDVRTVHISDDELGRLGEAFNSMAEDMSKLYYNLEDRVAEKTADLERSNQSLELLYHSISRLNDAPIAANTYVTLLKDLENVLGIGHGATCLIENDSNKAIVLASTLNPKEGDANLCKLNNCAECLQAASISLRRIGKHGEKQILSVPLQDMDRRYGVMQIEVPPGKTLEDWQMQLLEALSRHIGIAIGTAHRTEQSRRLSLLEERGVIARELHDSLAQSLSYMKIQVSRLQTAMTQHTCEEDANNILTELREGLNGAYRELRELLTTFRLKIEGNGLVPTLEKTVAEFAARGNIPISIESNLSGFQLSANEEIHIMQIVREALANVIHHSGAAHASVSIEHGPGDIISVIIDDDGVGIGSSQSATHHYGMSIMEERARSLGGSFHVQTRAVGGTRINFRFHSGDHSRHEFKYQTKHPDHR
jgi:two-component system, NarL family, nitrate/nitrite sensor histidine kinase NarX